MLARCREEWGFKSQYDIFRRKRGTSTRTSDVPDEEYCVEWRSTEKVLEERRMKKISANLGWGAMTVIGECLFDRRSAQFLGKRTESGRVYAAPNQIEDWQTSKRSAHGDWGVPIPAAERQEGGVRSATIQTEAHCWGWMSSHPCC